MPRVNDFARLAAFRRLAGTGAALAVGLCLVISSLTLPALSEPQAVCHHEVYEDHHFTLCQVDRRSMDVELFNLDANGKPFATLGALSEAREADSKPLLFAMNAGMYGEDLRPIGLYIEQGVQQRRINQRNGYGNFHLKPNGVFYVTADKLGVMTTEDYLSSGIKPQFATQSGPMLVIKGAIHPKLSPDGTSARIRNGVGEIDSDRAVFVISDEPVTFYQFASYFKDKLGADNALFFDGSISSIYSPNLGTSLNLSPLGPMVGVTLKKP